MIVRVEVERNGLRYTCQPVGKGWHCGQCTRGLIRPVVGEVCRVCNAVVVSVTDRTNTYPNTGRSHYRRFDS